jgi:hypothetical protein
MATLTEKKLGPVLWGFGDLRMRFSIRMIKIALADQNKAFSNFTFHTSTQTSFISICRLLAPFALSL